MIPTNQLLAQIIGSIKEQQTVIAESAVLRPSSSKLMTGLAAGKYQGLQLALDVIDNVLRDDFEKEQSS